MIAFARVDNRLIHGQVVEAWLPQLGVRRIVVLDDEAAHNPLTRAAMGLAVPSEVTVEILAASADLAAVQASKERVLLLFRDVHGAVAACARGLRLETLNLGNVHFAEGRVAVSPAVFLSRIEIGELEGLAATGVAIELRTLPRDRPLSLGEVSAKVP